MRVLVLADDPRIRNELAELARGTGLEVVETLGVPTRPIDGDRYGADAAIAEIGGLDAGALVELLGVRLTIPTVTVDNRDDNRLEAALDAGAADHVEHPIRPRELGARVRGAHRRRTGERAVIRTADFAVDLDARTATARGDAVHLTPREWVLVELLVTRRRRLVRHAEALAALGRANQADDAYLRGCMHAIRQKLEPMPGAPRYFLTIPRVGIRFDPEPAA